MAVQSRVGLQTDINNDIADNTTEDISPADVRGILTDINDSTVNKTTDTNLIGWYPFDATKNYYTNELVIYSGNLYQFNQNHTAGAWNSAHADLYNCTGATQFQASLSISSATLLALYTTPQTVITCPTGKTIIVTGSSFVMERQVTTPAAYATETDVWLITDTGSVPQVIFDNVLTHDGTYKAHMIGNPNATSFSAADIQLVSTKDLLVSCPTANPTAGNWNAIVYVTFRLV